MAVGAAASAAATAFSTGNILHISLTSDDGSGNGQEKYEGLGLGELKGQCGPRAANQKTSLGKHQNNTEGPGPHGPHVCMSASVCARVYACLCVLG